MFKIEIHFLKKPCFVLLPEEEANLPITSLPDLMRDPDTIVLKLKDREVCPFEARGESLYDKPATKELIKKFDQWLKKKIPKFMAEVHSRNRSAECYATVIHPFEVDSFLLEGVGSPTFQEIAVYCAGAGDLRCRCGNLFKAHRMVIQEDIDLRKQGALH